MTMIGMMYYRLAAAVAGDDLPHEELVSIAKKTRAERDAAVARVAELEAQIAQAQPHVAALLAMWPHLARGTMDSKTRESVDAIVESIKAERAAGVGR